MSGPENQPEQIAAARARALLSGTSADRIAAAQVSDPVTGRIFFTILLADGGEDGVWLATSEADEDGDRYSLTGFSVPAEAVGAFAARAMEEAEKCESLDLGWPTIAAGYLRYQAALARAGAARASLGDSIRASREQIRAERAVSRVAGMAGISREFLYRVLAGDEWTWRNLMPQARNTPPTAPDLTPPKAVAHTDWTVWVRFAIDSATEKDAHAVWDAILDDMDVRLAGEPDWAQANGMRTVTAQLDLSHLASLEPDNARTRLSYVSGRLPEQVSWASRVNDQEGSLSWPPEFWDRRPGADDQLLHPAVRAAMIHASQKHS
jgi:hypothetical protein